MDPERSRRLKAEIASGNPMEEQATVVASAAHARTSSDPSSSTKSFTRALVSR